MSPDPPTEHELNMAFTWTILNAIRSFHRVPEGEMLPSEQRFLEKWRAIPAERRQAALDFALPATPERMSTGQRTNIKRVKL